MTPESILLTAVAFVFGIFTWHFAKAFYKAFKKK